MGKLEIGSKNFKPKTSGQNNFLKGKEGDRFRIRIMEKDLEHGYKHYNPQANNFVMCCLTDGKYDTCPACEHPEIFNPMQDAFSVNVYNYTNKKLEMWNFGNDIYIQLETIKSILVEDKKKPDMRLYDLIVSFAKKGNKKGLVVTVQKAEGKSKMPIEQFKELSKKLFDLSKIMKVLSPQELCNKYGLTENESIDDLDDEIVEDEIDEFEEADGSEDDDLDEDEIDEFEEADGSEDDDLDEDEVEEKPKPKAKVKKAEKPKAKQSAKKETFETDDLNDDEDEVKSDSSEDDDDFDFESILDEIETEKPKKKGK